jgi:hypothetical protein
MRFTLQVYALLCGIGSNRIGSNLVFSLPFFLFFLNHALDELNLNPMLVHIVFIGLCRQVTGAIACFGAKGTRKKLSNKLAQIEEEEEATEAIEAAFI